MLPSFTRTLRLKVRAECYGWLNAAAVEVNTVFNFCNEAACSAATRTDLKRKWLSGFDLCNLTSGATEYFERIGADTIQRVCTEYAQRRGRALRFLGKTFRVFEHGRLEGMKWKQGCFAQDAVGDWWLCVPVAMTVKQRPAPATGDSVGIDLGTREVAVTSDGLRLEAMRFYRDAEGRLATLQRCRHRRQLTRLHRRVRRRRHDACHKFSHKIVAMYQNIRQLVVRQWECASCGESHDRDVNAARNILVVGSRCRTPVRGNESSPAASPLCEAKLGTLEVVA